MKLRPGSRARLGVLLIAVLSAGLTVSAAGPAAPSPYPSSEEVAQHGFAVWPEDTVDEAQEACDQHVDDQPWRLSPFATSRQFAKQILDHDNPRVDEEMSDVGAHDARVWLYAKEVFLSNIVELRRAGVCWFITHGEPRETGESATPVFVREDDSLKVYLEHYNKTSSEFDEIGFGEHTKTFLPGQPPYRRSWILPEGTDAEGHIMSLNWDKRGAEAVSASKLPAPPEIGGGEKIFPVGQRFTWAEIPEDSRKRSCRRSYWSAGTPRRVLNQVLEWEFDRAMPSGPYPDVLKVGRRGWIGKHVFISQLSEGVWHVRIDDVPFRFEVARATDDCWALDKIKARHKPRPIEEAFYDDTAVTLDFVWQNATRVGASLGYGEDSGQLGVHRGVPSRVATYRAEYGHPSPPGLIFVTLLRHGKYVNAFSRRIAPD